MSIEKITVHALHIKHPDIWEILDTTFSENLKATLEIINEEAKASLLQTLIYFTMMQNYTYVDNEVNQLLIDIHKDVCTILPNDFHDIAIIVISYFAVKNTDFMDFPDLLNTLYEFSLEDAV